VNSQHDLKPWPWELLSKFGNPWTDFAGFRGKTLGSRTRRFASESPGNDQFSQAEVMQSHAGVMCKSVDYCMTKSFDYCMTLV
jgi:hypothetical protein